MGVSSGAESVRTNHRVCLTLGKLLLTSAWGDFRITVGQGLPCAPALPFPNASVYCVLVPNPISGLLVGAGGLFSYFLGVPTQGKHISPATAMLPPCPQMLDFELRVARGGEFGQNSSLQSNNCPRMPNYLVSYSYLVRQVFILLHRQVE